MVTLIAKNLTTREKKKIKLPTDWHEMKLQQFIDLVNAKNEIEKIAAITGLPAEWVEGLSEDMLLSEIYTRCGWLADPTLIEKLTKIPVFDFRIGPYEFSSRKSIREMTLGQFFDAQNYMTGKTQIECFPYLIALYTFGVEDAEKMHKYVEENLSLYQGFALGSFFFRKWQKKAKGGSLI
jgi:hypothetical protein